MSVIPNGTLSDCAETICSAEDDADRVPPDTEYRYGGGPWQLAGGVAEQVSGKSWSELVEETYGPCGLEDTAYGNHFLKAMAESDSDVLTPCPTFFDGDPANLEPTDNPNLEGGARTTVTDYEKILLMHLRDGACDGGQVLSAEGVEMMRADRIGEVYDGSSFFSEYPGYGLGWFVSREAEVVADPGAYGASPWLDLDRGYGAMILLEGHYTRGQTLREQVQPLIDAHFDER
ncbi:MAG: beta-lactamase family protein [Proteobacteria bacterium]|nr:beta-lactamase family protein [Pseudomonadota bacterium]MCP4918169.1 beta-lactamase family protein [Pseudomonadota bacterium]